MPKPTHFIEVYKNIFDGTSCQTDCRKYKQLNYCLSILPLQTVAVFKIYPKN